MIRFNVEQGSQEWAMLRLGIPTASQFARVLTPKTMKTSGQMADYAHELLAEQVLKIPLDHASTGLMQRGYADGAKGRAIGTSYRKKSTPTAGGVHLARRSPRRVFAGPFRWRGRDARDQGARPRTRTSPICSTTRASATAARCKVSCGSRARLDRHGLVQPVHALRDRPAAARREVHRGAVAAAVKQLLDYMDECKLKLQKKGLFAGERVPDLRVVA
jgi:hypothetical protein